MRIVFICGSLERGRNGVGDYTRRLAEELIKQEHEVAMLALYDPYLTKAQEVKEGPMKELRLPLHMPLKIRWDDAKKWIDAFAPEWLSIQFVPYSFHPKGLPFRLITLLKDLTKKRHVQIMFHETWVSAKHVNDWKLKLLSLVQRYLIKHIISSARPVVIHTHLPAYKLNLEKLGYSVRKLPLFSNVELVGAKRNNLNRDMLRIGFFSQARSNESVTLFLTGLANQARLEKIKYEVVIIGGVEAKMQNFKRALEDLDLFRNRVRYLGFLTPEKVSEALQSCTLGITPVPRHGLGKSGSVAAFLAHGIPVAAPNVHFRHDANEIGFFTEELRSSVLLAPDLDKLKLTKKAAEASSGIVQVSSVAKIFAEDLQLYYS